MDDAKQPANDTQPTAAPAQQQAEPPEWAQQLAQMVNAKQSSSQPQVGSDEPAPAQTSSQPAAPDYGKADPDRIIRDAEFYAAKGTPAAIELLVDTYQKATGQVSRSEMDALKLDIARRDVALGHGLTADETKLFLTGNTLEHISQQAVAVKALKATQAPADQAQSQTTQQTQPASNQQAQQAQMKQDAQGNIIIVPGGYPDTRTPMQIAEAKLVEKAAKGENLYG